MGMYESFAGVYDMFMDDVPYRKWCARLTGLLRENGIRDGLVADLGCGTGSMTRLLAEAGYDMIGVDNSPEMLEIAMEKQLASENPDAILYLLQDMRSFELYGTVRAVVSVCDSLNYITEEAGLLQVFRLVNNYLDPGGIFIFDMNTPYKYETLLGNETFARSLEECSYIWENTWYPEEQINEYDLTLFVKKTDGLYRRFNEVHYQKAYTAEKICGLLKEAGMIPELVCSGYPGEEDTGERYLFAAREHGKAAQPPEDRGDG